MPKKTRKQKIQTDMRRQNAATTYVFTAQPTPQGKPVSTEFAPPHLITDIRKTLILGALFILFEVGLSLVSAKFGW